MPRGIPRSRFEETAPPVANPVPARALEMRRERRRRSDGDLDYSARLKLAIPTEIQEQAKREGKTLRWVSNDPGRLQQMQAADWDMVEGVESVSASRSDDSQLVLMSKYADWYEEDRKPIKELNDSRQAAAMRGGVGQQLPGDGGGPINGDGFYSPDHTQNRISQGA